MFFGRILTKDSPFVFGPESVNETQGEVLSITNVMLAPTSKDGATLWIKKDSNEYIIASLTKDKSHVQTNVFMSLLD